MPFFEDILKSVNSLFENHPVKICGVSIIRGGLPQRMKVVSEQQEAFVGTRTGVWS